MPDTDTYDELGEVSGEQFYPEAEEPAAEFDELAEVQGEHLFEPTPQDTPEDVIDDVEDQEFDELQDVNLEDVYGKGPTLKEQMDFTDETLPPTDSELAGERINRQFEAAVADKESRPAIMDFNEQITTPLLKKVGLNKVFDTTLGALMAGDDPVFSKEHPFIATASDAVRLVIDPLNLSGVQGEGVTSNLRDATQSGVLSALSTVLDVPDIAARVGMDWNPSMLALKYLSGSDADYNDLFGREGKFREYNPLEVLGQGADAIDEYVGENLSATQAKKFEKGTIGLVKDGQYKDAGELLAYQVAEATPQLIMQMFLAATIGPAQALTYMGLSAAGGENRAARDLEDIGQFRKDANTLVSASIEAVMERYLGVIPAVLRNKASKKVGKDALSFGFKKGIQTLMRTAGEEGLEEGATSIGQDISKLLTGVAESKTFGKDHFSVEKILQRAGEAFLPGFILGGVGGGVTSQNSLKVGRQLRKQVNQLVEAGVPVEQATQDVIDMVDAQAAKGDPQAQAKQRLLERSEQIKAEIVESQTPAVSTEQLTEEERAVVSPEVALDDRVQSALVPLVRSNLVSQEETDVLLETITEGEVAEIESTVDEDPVKQAEARAEVVRDMVEQRLQVAEEVLAEEKEAPFEDSFPQDEAELRAQVVDTLDNTETVTMETPVTEEAVVEEEPVVEPEPVTMETTEEVEPVTKETKDEKVSIVKPKKTIKKFPQVKPEIKKEAKDAGQKEELQDRKRKDKAVKDAKSDESRDTGRKRDVSKPVVNKEQKAIDTAVSQFQEKALAKGDRKSVQGLKGLTIEPDTELQNSEDTDWKNATAAAKTAGVKVVAIKPFDFLGVPVSGFVNRKLGVIFAASAKTVQHETFHQRIINKDKAALKLKDSVDVSEYSVADELRAKHKQVQPGIPEAQLDSLMKEEIAADLYALEPSIIDISQDLDKPGRATDVKVSKEAAALGWRIQKIKGGFRINPPKGAAWDVVDATAAAESVEQHKNDAEYQFDADVPFSIESEIDKDIEANKKELAKAEVKLAKNKSAKVVTSGKILDIKDSKDPDIIHKVSAKDFWAVKRPEMVEDAKWEVHNLIVQAAILQERKQGLPEPTIEQIIENGDKDQLDFLFSVIDIDTPSGILTPAKRDALKNKVKRAMKANPEVFNEKLSEALGNLNEHMKSRDKVFKTLEAKYRKAKAKNDQKAMDALWTDEQLDTLEKFYSLLPSYDREKFKRMARGKVLGAAKADTKAKYMDDIMRKVAERYERLREKTVLADIDKILRKTKHTMKKQNVSYDAWKYFDFIRQTLGKRNSKSTTLQVAPSEDQNLVRLDDLTVKNQEGTLTPEETMELTVLSRAMTIEGLEHLLAEMKEARLQGRLDFMEVDLARRADARETAEGIADVATKGKGVMSAQDRQRVERGFFTKLKDSFINSKGEALGRGMSLVHLLNISIDAGLKGTKGLYNSKAAQKITEMIVKARDNGIVMGEQNLKLIEDKQIELWGSVFKFQTASRKNRKVDYKNTTMVPSKLPYLERRMEAMDEKIESSQNPEAYIEAKAALQEQIDTETNIGQAPIPLSQNQAYKLWQLWQDESMRDHMERNGYDAEFIGNVEKFLNPEIKQWSQWQLDVLYPKLHGDQNPMYKKMFNMDLAKIPNYSPAVFHQGGESVDVGELLNEGEAVPTTTHGAMHARVNHTRDIRLVDGDVIMERAMSEGTHFAAWADTVRDLRSIFGNSTLKSAYEHQGMSGILKFINRNIDESASLKPLKENWKSIDRLRVSFVAAKLAANLTLYPKQIVSSIAVFAKMNPIEIAKSLAEGNFRADWKEFMAHAPLIRERYAKGFDRDIRKMESTLDHAAATGMVRQYSKKVMEYMSFIPKAGDLHGLMIAALPYYKQQRRMYLEQDMKPSEAIKQAALDTEVYSNMWQQSAEKMFMNDVQKGGSLAKAVTMFQSSQIAYVNQVVSSTINISKGSTSYSDYATVAIAWWAMPALFSYVRNGLDWDDEEMNQVMWFGILSQFGFLGDMIGKAHQAVRKEGKETGFPLHLSPLASTADQAIRGVTAVAKGNVGKGINDLANVVNDTTLGLPYDAMEKVITNWKEFTDEAEVRGTEKTILTKASMLRALTYSPYVIKKQQERAQERIIEAARKQYAKDKPKLGKERAELDKKLKELQELLRD